MSYAAVNIGELEVIEETNRWQELASAELPFVSTNAIVPPDSGVDTSRHLVREIETRRGRIVKVGFMGLASPSTSSLAIEFAEPVASARDLAGELRGQVDLLVALVQMPPESARELVRAVPEIDIVIGAVNDTHAMEPVFEGESLILYPAPQGMALGDLRLFFDQEGRPGRYFYRLVPLPSQLEDHPDWIEFQREAEAAVNAAKEP